MFQIDSHEEDIIMVEPYSYKPSSEKILSLLKPTIKGKNTVNDSSYSSFKLPISKGLDISKLIEENNLKIQYTSQKVLNYSSKQGDKLEKDSITVNDIDVVSKFVNLETFIPKNLQEQLATIIIRGLPNLKKLTIERLLQKLIIDQGFSWTLIDQDIVDRKIVFVRFKSISLACWFLENYSNNISTLLGVPGVQIGADDKLKEYMEIPKGKDNLEIKKIEGEIRRILNNENNSNRISESSGTEDLDEVLNYYSNYKIDDNELIDVPTNMKEMIVKDIIRFRSKVLIIEKQRRKNEIELERKKTGQRLKQIFEGREADNESIIKEENNLETNFPIVDEFDYMNDDEYDTYLKEKENEEIEKKFSEKFQHHDSKEAAERERLLQRLKNLQSYESDLIENKLDYIEEIKTNNGKNALYYSDHGEYLQKRNIKRAEEEKNDAIDMELEDDVEDEVEDEMKEVKMDIGNKANSEVANNEKDLANVVFNSLCESKINLIKEKVSNLIEEYLGINDEFLDNMILEFLMKNNLKSKDDLIKELSEPLDDDAPVLVNDLWTFVSSLI